MNTCVSASVLLSVSCHYVGKKLDSLKGFIPFQSTAHLPFRVFIAVEKYPICSIHAFAACLLADSSMATFTFSQFLSLDLYLVGAQS